MQVDQHLLGHALAKKTERIPAGYRADRVEVKTLQDNYSLCCEVGLLALVLQQQKGWLVYLTRRLTLLVGTVGGWKSALE